MKVFKRIMVGIAVLAALVIVLVVGSYVMLRSAPSFYRRVRMTPEQSAAAAEQAERKFNVARQQVATAHAAERKNATNPSHPVEPIVMSFSAGELTAFFGKWAEVSGWKEHYEPYLSDPEVFVEGSRLILAGEVKEMKMLVSLHFRPELDENGKLNLNLEQVLGGRMPLPDMLLQPQKEKLEDALKGQLPTWQEKAKLSSTGTADLNSVAAAMSKLLLAGLEHQSADNTFFLPLDYEGHKNVPVKLTKLAVDEKGVTLTALPLNADERAALLARLREPYGKTAAVTP